MTLLKTLLKYFKDFLRKICSVAIKDESETRKISNLKGQIRIRTISGTIIPDPDPTWPRGPEPTGSRSTTLRAT
jgi:hypothetical protein